MADPNTSVSSVTPPTTPAAIAAPVAPVTTTVAPAASPAPITETVITKPAVEATVAPAAPVEPPAPAVTVVGEALDAKPQETPPKAEETKPTEETKAQEGQSDEPAPPPTYEPFTVPEGITLDTERLGKFTELLGGLENKAKGIDHAVVQQFGQDLVNYHVQEVKTAVESLQKMYIDTWEKQKTDWKDQFMKDAEIGGNRFETTVTAARDFIRTHGGTPEQQQEFRNVMESSGLGNHPAVIRLLSNAGRAMEEAKPLAATIPVTPPKSKVSTLYGPKASQ